MAVSIEARHSSNESGRKNWLLVRENRPTASGYKNDMSPSQLYAAIREEGTYQGALHYPQGEESPWYRAEAGSPYIEPPHGWHRIIFNKDDRYTRLTHMQPEQLEPAMKAVTETLWLPNTVALLNISGDKQTHTSVAQSMQTPHIHLLGLPGQMDTLAEPGEGVKDPANPALLSLYTRGFINHPKADGAFWQQAELLRPDEIKALPFAIDGMVAAFPADISSHVLAEAVLDFAKMVEDVHKEIAEIYVSNYDAVRESDWQVPYEPRPALAVYETINTMNDIDPAIAQDLKRIYRRFRGQEGERHAGRRIPKSPTYSAAFFRHTDVMTNGSAHHEFNPAKEKLHFAWGPNALIRGGACEMLGMTVKRRENDNSIHTGHFQEEMYQRAA